MKLSLVTKLPALDEIRKSEIERPRSLEKDMVAGSGEAIVNQLKSV